MTSSERALAALVPLFLVLALGAPARAERTAEDIASARRLYNEGIDLRAKGNMAGALEKFRAAHALGNTPITGVELCRAYSAMHQPVEAREACLSVARIAPTAEESERSKGARTDAATLAEAERAKIGSVRIKVTGVPAGVQPTVVVDGRTVPQAALNEPRAVNPGVHTIGARVGTGPETRATLETHEGETRDLELAVQPPPPGEEPAPAAPPGQPAPPAPEKKSNTFATVSFATAGVAAALGAVAGVVAMSSEGNLDDACASKICGREQWDELSSARTWGDVSTVAFVVAGVALGAGFISMIASSPRRSGARVPPTASPRRVRVSPVVGLGGAGIHGSF